MPAIPVKDVGTVVKIAWARACLAASAIPTVATATINDPDMPTLRIELF
jgi:hypothetical protein